MVWCQNSTISDQYVQIARDTGRAGWCLNFPPIYSWGQQLVTSAVIQLGSRESGFRGLWDYICMVWAHSGRIYFICFACKLPWSQKRLASIMTVLKLNIFLSGTGVFCFVCFLFFVFCYVFFGFFFFPLELKMPPRFCWFAFEIQNRVKTLTFLFCLRFVVCNSCNLIV